LVLLIAIKPINSIKNNQAAVDGETLASIKVKTNKTAVARILKISIATFFYVENESSPAL
jgi:chorismate synthase